MAEAEERYKNGVQNLTDFIGSEPSKKRKRRTSFTPQALEVLNEHFERNTHPSGTLIPFIQWEGGAVIFYHHIKCQCKLGLNLNLRQYFFFIQFQSFAHVLLSNVLKIQNLPQNFTGLKLNVIHLYTLTLNTESPSMSLTISSRDDLHQNIEKHLHITSHYYWYKFMFILNGNKRWSLC